MHYEKMKSVLCLIERLKMNILIEQVKIKKYNVLINGISNILKSDKLIVLEGYFKR
jgi:hypothetical protein